jgi:hypothetical protein
MLSSEVMTEWPDGSRVHKSANASGKWAVLTTAGYLLDDGKMRYFDRREAATQALTELGQGPGRQT